MTGKKYGGLVCEYNGDFTEEETKKSLGMSFNELYINGFDEEFELRDIILNNIKEKIDFMSDNKIYDKYLKLVQAKKMNPIDAADKISKLIIK